MRGRISGVTNHAGQETEPGQLSRPCRRNMEARSPEVGQRMRVEKQNRGSLVIRLFGPLAIQDGGRTLGPPDLGRPPPKQVLDILPPPPRPPPPTQPLPHLLC